MGYEDYPTDAYPPKYTSKPKYTSHSSPSNKYPNFPDGKQKSPSQKFSEPPTQKFQSHLHINILNVQHRSTLRILVQNTIKTVQENHLQVILDLSRQVNPAIKVVAIIMILKIHLTDSIH